MTGLDGASSAATRVAGPLTGFLARWLRQQLWPDTSRTSLNRATEDLADTVARRETMFREQLRSGPDRSMDLSFGRVSSDGLADRGALLSQSGIGRCFRGLATPARLVVLGEAGGGKTVMANRLVLDLLERRANLPDNERNQEPVPLRVNMADWSAEYDFRTWIIRRISSDYRIHPRTARALVDDGRRILPVLDGLDQMDVATDAPHRACIALDRLNETPWRNRPVIVTCRTEIYDQVRDLQGDAGLHGAVMIRLRPLTNAAIVEYLNAQCRQIGVGDDRSAPVADKIRSEPDGALATSLSAPWVLALAATAIRGGRKAVVGLAKAESATEISDHLLAGLIPAAVNSSFVPSRGHRYSEAQVQMWMRALAGFLEERKSQGVGGTEFSLAQVWHLAGPLRCRLLYGALIGSVVAALCAVIYGVTLLQSFGYPLNVGLGLGFGTCVGAFVALWTIVVDRHGRGYQRLAWRVPQRSRWWAAVRQGVRRGFTGTVVVGLILGAFATLLFDSTTGLTLGVTAATAIGIGGSLLGWSVAAFTTTAEHQEILGYQARRVVRDDALTGLWGGLITGLTYGVAVGWMVWKTHGSMWLTNDGFRFLDYGFADPVDAAVTHSLITALVTGIACGALLGCTAGRHAVATVVFRTTGEFASRPARFLEWACAAGLLSVNGLYYSIRHETLHDWLLGTALASDSTPGAVTYTDLNTNRSAGS